MCPWIFPRYIHGYGHGYIHPWIYSQRYTHRYSWIYLWIDVEIPDNMFNPKNDTLAAEDPKQRVLRFKSGGGYSLGAYSLGAYSLGPPDLGPDKHSLDWGLQSRGLQSGGLQSGGLQSRTTRFGSGSVLTRLEALYRTLNCISCLGNCRCCIPELKTIVNIIVFAYQSSKPL